LLGATDGCGADGCRPRGGSKVRPVQLLRRGAALLLLLAFGAVGGCGSHTRASDTSSAFEGLVVQPPKPEPALTLRNYTGNSVDLSTLRGKAVLLTFVYTHCPDVCPLMVSKLAAAERQLGPEAPHLQIVAVTVDPKNDTPRAVTRFLAARGATGRMDYLVGTLAQLVPIWRAWGIYVIVNKQGDTQSHSALVLGITSSGKIVVAYPSNFTPAQIVHDVPLLAHS
jgi:protein SCO1